MVDFASLPEEKQQVIVNVGLTLFGKNGYKKTSTAEIAAAAGISKASLFQYFGSKRGMYTYLFEYTCAKIYAETPVGTDDFFECLRLASDVKQRVMTKNPGMYDFLYSFTLEADENVTGELKRLVAEQTETAMTGLLCNVNWNKLKPGIDPQMLMNAVRWITEGYLRDAPQPIDYQTARQEIYQHLDLIQTAYYKEEYL